jgi:flavin-dependent dehydrogenase
VGADGAQSVTRPAAGVPRVTRQALALRGYAPTPNGRAGRQLIVFGEDRQPSYAWSFDRGDGMANVGYGEILRPDREPPTRRLMLDRLEALLPGATEGAEQWRAHHLPLSSRRWTNPDGRLLLVGDAAGLINPLTGEGIYYAVATGVLAGRAAAAALRDGRAGEAGARYRAAVQALLAGHLRHTDALSRAAASPFLVAAAVAAAAREQRVFDDLVELGLGRGRMTLRAAAGVLVSALATRRGRYPSRRAGHTLRSTATTFPSTVAWSPGMGS